MTEYECIECGCRFSVEMIYEDAEESVTHCVNCGSQLEDDIDLNIEDEDEL